MDTLVVAILGIIVGYVWGKALASRALDESLRHHFHHFFEHYIGSPPGDRKTVTKTGALETKTETRGE